MHSNNNFLSAFIFLLAVMCTSCITSSKLTYLQNTFSLSDTALSVQPEAYRIKPFDNLYIKVVTPDPQWSQMFNTMDATSSNSSMTEQSADLISYSVDKEGYINVPYVGKLEVADKTLFEIKSDLDVLLKGYITDASVTVKMINNFISILGEVKKPGKYQIYKDRLNIFQALAMAEDLNDFSNRQKIKIIRPIPGGNIVKEFSLTDNSILTSQYYYVMPNDVIYAQPIKGRFFQMNSFPYTLILGTLTTFILFWNVLK
jgi:polysaccharide biosynthesis/export protein